MVEIYRCQRNIPRDCPGVVHFDTYEQELICPISIQDFQQDLDYYLFGQLLLADNNSEDRIQEVQQHHQY